MNILAQYQEVVYHGSLVSDSSFETVLKATHVCRDGTVGGFFLFPLFGLEVTFVQIISVRLHVCCIASGFH